jgi:transposase|tara:strand:- start:715 stop:1077 length:363 start_codon:yes stop_codon:yes gene_type:complete
MVRAYSDDLRIRVIRAVAEDGESARSAGRRYGVSESAAIKWVSRFNQDGSVSAQKSGRPRGLKVVAHRDFLVALMKDRDNTLDELQRALLEQRGMYASRALLWRFVHDEGLSYKKNTACQ